MIGCPVFFGDDLIGLLVFLKVLGIPSGSTLIRPEQAEKVFHFWWGISFQNSPSQGRYFLELPRVYILISLLVAHGTL